MARSVPQATGMPDAIPNQPQNQGPRLSVERGLEFSPLFLPRITKETIKSVPPDSPFVERDFLRDTGEGIRTVAPFVPVIGDGAGVIDDVVTFIEDSESRTPLNFGLAVVGAAFPFVPSATKIRHVFGTSEDVLRKNQSDAINQLAVHATKVVDRSAIFYDVIGSKQATEILPGISRYLAPGAQLELAVRVIDADAIRHVVKKHSFDKIPFRNSHFQHVPEVLRTGELIGIEKRRGEVAVTWRKLVDGNWLYAIEALSGSKSGRPRQIAFRLKTAYWTPGPKS